MMAQFQVPQYIEVQEKIVGPLTLKQFFYLAAAGAIIFLTFWIFQFWLWLIISALAIGAAGALAFIKINGQSLPKLALAAFQYFWQPRLYVWQREEERKETAKQFSTQQRLKDLAEKLLTSRLPLAEKKERFVRIRRVSGAKELAKKVDYP